MTEATNNILPASIKLDQSGICFLCLRNTEFDLNGSFPSALSTGPEKQSYSIRNITRFLEINVGEILIGGSIQRQLDQLIKEKEDDTDVKVSVCEDCSLMTERFSNLYQTLELTKLRISQCLERIYDLMLAAENDSNRLDTSPASSRSLPAANGKEIFRKTCNYEEILMNMKALRRATIFKCTRKLKNLPDNVVQVPEQTFNDVNVNMEVEVSDSFLASSTIDDIKRDDLSNVKTEEVRDSDVNARSSKYCKAVKVETREGNALQHPIPISARNDMETMDFDQLETTPNPKVSELPSSVEIIDLSSDSGSLLDEPFSDVNTDFENGLGEVDNEEVSKRDVCKRTRRQRKRKKLKRVKNRVGLGSPTVSEQVAIHNDLVVTQNDIESADSDHLNPTLPDVSDPLASVEIDFLSNSGSLLEPLNSIASTDLENGQGDREEVPSTRRRGHRCNYCKAGGTFRQKYTLELHMISYHCETSFQAEKNVRCSKNQLRVIIYHFLFKDLNIFFERKLKVFSCLHCEKKFNLHNNKNTTTLKLHLFRYHHELLARKLLEIEEDPDLNAKLEAACWDKGTCEYCDTYHPNKITLDIHQRSYCPAVNNSWKVKVDSQRRQGRRNYTTCETCGKVMTKSSIVVHRRYVCKQIKRQPGRKKIRKVSQQVAIHKDLAVTSANNDIGNVESDHFNTILPHEPLNSSRNGIIDLENGLGDTEDVSSSRTRVDGGCQCHSKLFRCEYCRAGNLKTAYVLHQHMFSYHCELFFPTVKHFHYSDNQFRMIIYHLLFKDLDIFFENKLDVFSCLHCEKKFSGPMVVSTYLKLHLLKYHHKLVVRKLLEILEGPDVNAKLEAVCLDKGTCKYCNTYHPTIVTLDFHEKRYCPAGDNSMSSRKANLNCQQRQGRNKYTTCEQCGKVMKPSVFLYRRGKWIKRKKEKVKGVLPGKTLAETEAKVDRQRRMRKRITCVKCGISMTKISILCHRQYCEGRKEGRKIISEQVAIDNDLAVASSSSTPNSSLKRLFLPPNMMVKCSSCGKLQLLSDFAKQKRCSCSGVSLDISNFSSDSSSVPNVNSETIDISSATTSLTSSSRKAMREESHEFEKIDGNMVSSCDDENIIEIDPLG